MAKSDSEALVRTANRLLEDSQKKVNEEALEWRCEFLANAYGRPLRRSDDSSLIAILGGRADTVIHVNKALPIVRASVASLYAKRPDIIVKPRLAQWDDQAVTAEVFLNYAARRQDHAEELNLCLTAASLLPYGVLKLGVRKPDGMPVITWIPTASFRADPAMQFFEPERGRWCAFKYKRTVGAMRDSGLYEEAAVDKLAAELMKHHGSAFSETSTEVWMWEHYLYESVEGKRTLLVLVQPDAMNFLIREEDFSDVAGLPCRALSFIHSMGKEYFPASPVELWMDQQKELNAIRSNQLIHSDRAQRKYIITEGAFDEEELQKFTSTEPVSAMVTKLGDARQAAALLEQANMSADVYQVEQRIVDDIQTISGLGDMHLGASQATPSRSATEASIIEGQLRLRASDRQDVFERFLERLYHGYLSLGQKHLKATLQIKIAGSAFQQVSRDGLEGDFDVTVGFSSTLPSDRKLDWERAKEVYQIVANNPLVNQRKALLWLLGRIPDVKDAPSWIADIPDVLPGAPGPEGVSPENGATAGGLAALLNQNAVRGLGEGASPLSMAAGFRRAVSGPPGI